jgi:hypothetical protein
MRNRREQDKAQTGPYEELIKKIDATVNAAKTVPAVNEAYAQLVNLNHIWDSKLYARAKIREAAKAINASWDATTSQFAGPKPEAPPVGGHTQSAGGPL